MKSKDLEKKQFRVSLMAWTLGSYLTCFPASEIKLDVT